VHASISGKSRLEFSREDRVVHSAEEPVSEAFRKFLQFRVEIGGRETGMNGNASEAALPHVEREQGGRYGPDVGRIEIEVRGEDSQALRIRRFDGKEATGLQYCRA
jgi:hypothetical protein